MSEHRVTEPLGRPVLNQEELEVIARRWELKSENAKLGAILRRFLDAGNTEYDWGTETVLAQAIPIGRSLTIDSEVEITAEEFALIKAHWAPLTHESGTVGEV